MQINYIPIGPIFEGIPLKRKTLEGELKNLSPEFAARLRTTLNEIALNRDIKKVEALIQSYRGAIATIANPVVDREVLAAALERHRFMRRMNERYFYTSFNIEKSAPYWL